MHFNARFYIRLSFLCPNKMIEMNHVSYAINIINIFHSVNLTLHGGTSIHSNHKRDRK